MDRKRPGFPTKRISVNIELVGLGDKWGDSKVLETCGKTIKREEFGQRAHFHTYLLAYLVALAEHIIVSPSKRIYQNIR